MPPRFPLNCTWTASPTAKGSGCGAGLGAAAAAAAGPPAREARAASRSARAICSQMLFVPLLLNQLTCEPGGGARAWASLWCISRPAGNVRRHRARSPPRTQPLGDQRRGCRAALALGPSLGCVETTLRFLRFGYRGAEARRSSCSSARCRASAEVAVELATVLERRDRPSISRTAAAPPLPRELACNACNARQSSKLGRALKTSSTACARGCGDAPVESGNRPARCVRGRLRPNTGQGTTRVSPTVCRLHRLLVGQRRRSRRRERQRGCEYEWGAGRGEGHGRVPGGVGGARTSLLLLAPPPPHNV